MSCRRIYGEKIHYSIGDDRHVRERRGEGPVVPPEGSCVRTLVMAAYVLLGSPLSVPRLLTAHCPYPRDTYRTPARLWIAMCIRGARLWIDAGKSQCQMWAPGTCSPREQGMRAVELAGGLWIAAGEKAR